MFSREEPLHLMKLSHRITLSVGKRLSVGKNRSVTLLKEVVTGACLRKAEPKLTQMQLEEKPFRPGM
jgi:hypothetical protein